MKNLIRKTVIGLLILVAILGVAVMSIGRKPFNRFIEQQVISAANSQGIRLALKDTQFGLRSLYARSGEIFLPQALFLLPFQELTVTPHWLSILLGEIGVSLEAQLAQGSGRARLVQTGAETVRIDSDLTDIQVAELSQFAAFGISEGILSVKADGLTLKEELPSAGELNLSLEKMEKPFPNKINVMVSGLAIPIEIPEIHRGSIKALVNFTPGKTNIKSIESKSSWGTVSGTGEIVFDTSTRQMSGLHIKGEVHLSEEGHPHFRSFLPLLSQGILKLETTAFTFEVSGKPPALKTRFFDLG